MVLSGLFLLQKKIGEKVRFFVKNHGLTPFAKCRLFSTFLEVYFWGLKSILFYLEYQKLFLSVFFFANKKTYEKKVDFFGKNHGLTPLHNFDFLDFFRTLVVWSKKHCFLFKISKNVFSWLSLSKRKNMKKRSIFWKKARTNPFEKSRFF